MLLPKSKLHLGRFFKIYTLKWEQHGICTAVSVYFSNAWGKKDLAGAWGWLAPTRLWGRDKTEQCREKHLSLIRSLLVSSGSNVGSFETLAAIKEKIYRSSTKKETIKSGNIPVGWELVEYTDCKSLITAALKSEAEICAEQRHGALGHSFKCREEKCQTHRPRHRQVMAKGNQERAGAAECLWADNSPVGDWTAYFRCTITSLPPCVQICAFALPACL